MTKDIKKIIERYTKIIIVAIIVFILVSLLIILSPTRKDINNCYNTIGKENITKEYWDDWEQHVYINNTLVCAHGVVNQNGLKEEMIFTPFPSIRIINLT